MKYLVIKLTLTAEKLYQINYLPLLNEIKSVIQKTHQPDLMYRVSKFGKMILLPKILYKFQMLSIPRRLTYFKILKVIITNYIWQNKKQRIKFAVLRKNKIQGGIGGARCEGIL